MVVKMKQSKPAFIKGSLSVSEEKALSELGIKSFVHEYARLRKMASDTETSGEQTSHALLRAQLAATIRAIGIMDRSFDESGGRNAYSYVAVHNLARELAHDLRSFGDQSETVERVRRDSIQPMLSGLATQIVSRLLKARQSLTARLQPKSAKMVETELRRVQEELTAVFAEAEATAADRLKASLTAR